jgi:hypothetical protein
MGGPSGVFPVGAVGKAGSERRFPGPRHHEEAPMTETDQPRPDVVDAIVAVLKGADPSGLPPSATKAEKDAAKDRYLSEFAAERSKRDRQTRAWELMLTRSYDEPPTWQRLFDDLSPDVVEQLGGLYDALPAGAQEEYARRYGVPSRV